jgi:flagellin
VAVPKTLVKAGRQPGKNKVPNEPGHRPEEKVTMLSIRSNIASFDAQRNMNNTSNSLQKSMERLSSGFRINRAGDDAAGLAISEKLKAQVGGLMQAARNAGDGISMIQTAEGGMDEVQSMLQRMRELAVEASNDTLGKSERLNIGKELNALKLEANNVASRTKFNGIGLLSGGLAGQAVSTAGIAGTAAAASITATGATLAANISDIDVSGALGGHSYSFSGTTGTGQITLTDTTTNESFTFTMTDPAAGDDVNFDFGDLGVKFTVHATGDLSTDDLLTQLKAQGTVDIKAGTGPALLQSGANSGDTTAVAVSDVQLNGSNKALKKVWTDVGTFNSDAGATQDNASKLIATLDTALDHMSTERSKLGAAQNRLEHSISNLNSQAGNLDASNSRIRDVDVAAESGAMARSNILMQAGVSVLAQANQMPQLALKLLG